MNERDLFYCVITLFSGYVLQFPVKVGNKTLNKRHTRVLITNSLFTRSQRFTYFIFKSRPVWRHPVTFFI